MLAGNFGGAICPDERKERVMNELDEPDDANHDKSAGGIEDQRDHVVRLCG
jgi:hypothetical protein